MYEYIVLVVVVSHIRWRKKKNFVIVMYAEVRRSANIERECRAPPDECGKKNKKYNGFDGIHYCAVDFKRRRRY